MLHLDRLAYQQGGFSLRVDFKIAAGDRVAVIGPSGGGKSTLLNAIAGFLAPTNVGQVLVLAAAWTTIEWLRGWLLTGFAWNPIGAAWVFSDAMIQSTALVGVYGLGLLTVITAAMPGVLGLGGNSKPVVIGFILIGPHYLQLP